MTSLLFVGAEDLDFLPVSGSYGTVASTSTIWICNTAGYFRAGYGRCALLPGNGSWIQSPYLGDQSTLGIAASVFSHNGDLAQVTGDFLHILDASGVVRLALKNTCAPSVPVLYKVSAARTYTELATGTSNFSSQNTGVDRVDILIDYATAGSFDMWINGTPTIAYSGDVTTDSNTAISALALSCFGTSNDGHPDNSGTAWSEIMISVGDTRGYTGMLTVPPAGDGATQEWTGSYADIDGLGYVDTTVITAAAAADVGEFTTDTSPPAGNFNVDSIWMSVRAQAGDTGPQHIELGVNVAGSDYWSDSLALGTGMALAQTSWSQNPATSAPWLLADVAQGNLGLSVQAIA